MKKRLFFTHQAREFIAKLPKTAQDKVFATFQVLAEQGFLTAPRAEKVVGQDNLFEVRVKDSAGQYRVFYFYHTMDAIWALSGFQKKSQKTPLSEIRKALEIRKGLGYEK